MTALNLEAPGESVRVDVSIELPWRLRDDRVYHKEGRFILAGRRVAR